mmetsp:Transcript_33216/g.87325  ORF Transcript_33216/g.87325 Transcript_33216/m.87325 type:complete len:331 (-) Transcript_33216:585-1577(-)
MGHVISFWITLCLMLLVYGVLGREAFFGPRANAPFKTRFGPLIMFTFAVVLIMVDPSRHVIQDSRAWPWCGNNPVFNRINETSGWSPQCEWSSTQYQCNVACCVSTWLNTSDATPGSPTANTTTYAWFPPSADFYAGEDSGPIPGPFLTKRPDGTLYAPEGFDTAASMPYQLYTSTVDKPLAFYETGEVNPLQGGKTAADCLYGVNEATGYCFMTDQSLSYEDQLEQLGQWGAGLADPSLPFNKTSNSYVCACDSCTPTEDFQHLSTVGVLVTIVCTYLGFILLAVAVGWNANIIGKFGKIGAKWRKLRGAMKKASVQEERPEYTSATLP